MMVDIKIFLKLKNQSSIQFNLPNPILFILALFSDRHSLIKPKIYLQVLGWHPQQVLLWSCQLSALVVFHLSIPISHKRACLPSGSRGTPDKEHPLTETLFLLDPLHHSCNCQVIFFLISNNHKKWKEKCLISGN